MKVGVSLHITHAAGLQPTGQVAIARKAEGLGYDSIWLGDHMVLPREIKSRTYPYAVDHKAPPGMGQPDSLYVFAYMAGATQRIRMGTSVFILPLRNPLAVAHAVASLDFLSNGRFTFGVGMGWLKEEFEIVGEKYEDRGARMGEMLQVLKGLWSHPSFEFHGKHYSFGPTVLEPKPVQRPHTPILLGGVHPDILRCVALYGDGWISASKPTGPRSPAEVKEVLQRINRMRRDAGREKQPFQVLANAPPSLEAIRRYEDAGVTGVMTRPWDPPQGPLTPEHAIAGLERFAETVLSKL